ncbi:GNAT family N-acetyltransferase [Ornithinibacillus salinisoli]|uniref:GNAT family N-acetyltransferase n=1 Tax=Ornithinibacillus salinisoli TaxID=1848459 RepID=A0ABW4W2W2_9BACI
MVKKVSLVSHNLKHAERMSSLSSDPYIKAALGLTDEQTSIEGTRGFIEFILEEEKLGRQFSRVILNETEDLIGVITLKNIDRRTNTCHIGTWIGYPYWGKGYNVLAKENILYTAFTELGLERVFAGAKTENIRSQKSQEKLPYVRIDVEMQFPEEHRKLEEEVQSPCVLNVIEKKDFLRCLSPTKFDK